MKINLETLKTRCNSQIEDYFSQGEVIQTADGPYIYKDNNAKVLAVVHLDTVRNDQWFEVLKLQNDYVIYNTQLDDRLGAYIVLDILPTLGVKCDVLLTTGEEKGRSTALYFEPTKDYNWMFSFDRRGDDVVCYRYEDKELTYLLKDAGFFISSGSFSDICFLEHLQCKGMNFGVGYHNEHTVYCHVKLSETARQLGRFLRFWKANKDKKLPHYEREFSLYDGWAEGLEFLDGFQREDVSKRLTYAAWIDNLEKKEYNIGKVKKGEESEDRSQTAIP